jgi:uncharacterized membrane protein (UPF0182 family)
MSDPAARLLRGGRIFIASLVLAVALLLVGRGLSSFFIEVLWFRSEGYSQVFWIQFIWGWGLRLLAFLVSWVLVSYNLRLVSRTMAGIQIRRRFGDLEIQEQLPDVYIRWAVVGIGALMGLWIAATIPLSAGTSLLVLLKAPPWGSVEPLMGRDLGFYVFVLPAVIRVLAFALLMSFLLLSLAGAGYVSTGGLRVIAGRLELRRESLTHLGILGAGFLILLAARFWIARYLLLMDGSSGVEGIFGYTDARARMPALQFLTLASVIGAGAVLYGSRKRRSGVILSGVGLVVLGSLLVGQVYPSLIQRFQVEPNELERETPYIEHALEFTRQGFGLQGLDRQVLDYQDPSDVSWDGAERQLSGLPIWSSGALLVTFRQREARFRYYDFATVAVDRYPGPEGPVPLAVSVREIDPLGIDDPNWQNLHLRELYVSGMGAVASAANGATAEGRPVTYLGSLHPEVSPGPEVPGGLALERPQVFFGSRSQLYAIINPAEDAFLAPDASPGAPGVDYPGGIQLSSPLRTLALAWRFRDASLLFASEVTSESRFVFRRQVHERVRAVAPFLDFPEAPYPVVHEGRIVWILDGFTSTRNFPLSTPHEFGLRRQVAYVRGSVKVTVDAVTGEMAFFSVDPADPLLGAWSAVFPGLIQTIEAMPDGLREHIRYPKPLLDLQSRVLARYHLETAPLFHGRQDVWSLAQELGAGTMPMPYRAEYGIYRLPGERSEEFLLTTVFVPAGRQNLTGILAARSESDRYGELVLFDVPVEDQVPGPRQVEALIEQDPAISQQFSLWRQGGSQVWSGHLHLVPLNGTLLYMEPILLAAEEDAIPELRRFVVSDGRRVAMEPTLAGAIAALAPQGLRGRESPAEELTGAPAPDSPSEEPTGVLSDEALRLLDEAESRLREGDWQGFGEALSRLRRLLEGGAGNTGLSPAGSP